jgi:UDP-2,3-diacylglucosamine pyrophosphatase LpxH
MGDIRYVCLSDMHLGEEDSLLTKLKTAGADPETAGADPETAGAKIDPESPSPVMKQLTECIKTILAGNEKEKPTLVLNGDILELALATMDEAAMVFERFIECIMPPGEEMFGKIIYIPGNHDHHIWEVARESQYSDFVKTLKPKTKLERPWHATNIFVENDPNEVPAYFLTTLVQRYDHLKEFKITTAYPNFGVSNNDTERCVIFQHGHFFEPLYQLMSQISDLFFPERQKPQFPWDIETENFAWIDFFWSALGRSGKTGADVELFYEKMQNLGEFKKFLGKLAVGLAKKCDLPGWGNEMEASLLKGLIGFGVDKIASMERSHGKEALSEDAVKGLEAYMNGPMFEQILNESTENLGYETTLVFGHTHKPFSRDIDFAKYSQVVNVYNTGGWIVDTDDTEPIHGGAVVLIDEDLNAVSLRMYNENEDPGKYAVRVEQAKKAAEPNDLYDRISALVDPGQDPWKTFSMTAARTVDIRREHLRARIRS